MKQKIIIAALVLFAVAYGCKHQMVQIGTSPTPVPVTPPTDTSSGHVSDTVCFQAQVLPLYQTYCARASGCHSGNGGGEGSEVVLTDYWNIMKGIRAKNPSESDYFTRIGHGMPPKNEPNMSSDQIATIQKWINQGALNTTCSGGTCDTSKYTYTNSASIIFATHCNGCHGVAPGSGNTVLSSYTSAVAAVNNNKQLFLNAINYTAAISAQNMPQGGKLSDCEIQQLTKWVNKGMPQ